MSIFVFSMYCKLRAHSTLNYMRSRPVHVIRSDQKSIGTCFYKHKFYDAMCGFQQRFIASKFEEFHILNNN